MRGVEANKDSFLYGEFRMPGVLTNDLVNNKEFNNAEQDTISMRHLKSVS